MKTLFIIIMSFFVFCFGLSDLAVAQTKNQKNKNTNVKISANIAVIDMLVLRRSGKSFRHLRKQIRAYREQLKGTAQNEDTELQKANRELARQRAIITPEAFREQRKKFEKRVSKAQRDFQSRVRSLKEAERAEEKKIFSAVQASIIDVAEKNKLIYILRKSALVFWPDSLDVTKKVLNVLDKKMPKIKIAVPKGFSKLSASKRPKKK